MKRNGYTLVEVLVTLCLVGTLAAVGLPSLREFVEQSRLSGLVGSYLQAFNSARAIAVSARRDIAICELDGRGRCTGRWGREITLFFDDDRDGVLRERADIILAGGHGGLREVDVSFRAFRTTRYVGLRSSGLYRQNGTFRFCPRGAKRGRAIVINVAGRARVAPLACPG